MRAAECRQKRRAEHDAISRRFHFRRLFHRFRKTRWTATQPAVISSVERRGFSRLISAAASFIAVDDFDHDSKLPPPAGAPTFPFDDILRAACAHAAMRAAMMALQQGRRLDARRREFLIHDATATAHGGALADVGGTRARCASVSPPHFSATS